jgi:YesN/AraC family two-component response regulator
LYHIYRQKTRAFFKIPNTVFWCREIALSLGFETAAYFSRFFKKQTGVTPMTYKKGTV